MIAAMAMAITGFVGTQTADAVDPVAHQGNKVSFPGNDGQPHTVTWDEHSYMVDGERLVIWSGELHHWRVPHEDGWRDVFQKLRAAGFNAVSLYFFWGLHQSEEGGPFDFSGPRDLDRLLTLAAEEGLYVIARPGPYVNAEIAMGGLPAYFTNKSTGSLRGTDPSVLEPSKEWLAAFNDIAREHQVTDGGGSIVMYQVENELIADNAPRRAFLKELAEFVRADGITVPLFHNDYGLGGRFSDSENLGLDFYAYDWYPLGFSCDAGRGRISDQEQNFRNVTDDSPHFITEAQGGAFSPWGAPWTENNKCAEFVDPAFTRQWGMNNIGQGVTAFNYYMIIGGTNWGYTGAPGSGFTSYDYGSALNEDRTITPKLAVQKELGYYQRAVPQLASMSPVAAGAAGEVAGATVNVYQRLATEDLDTSVTGNGARFIGARLNDSNSTTETSFTIPLNLGEASGPVAEQFSDDDRSSRITYNGAWTQLSDATAYEQTLTQSSTSGATATVTFSGTGLEVIGPKAPRFGRATISIDGGPAQPINAYYNTDQNAPAQAVLYSASDLAAGDHTAVITVSGTAGGESGGTNFALDAVNILGGGGSQVVQATYNNSDTDFFTYSPAPVNFSPGSGSEAATWTRASGFAWTAGNIGGDETYTRTAGNSVEFTFTGTGFDVIAAFSTNHGPAEVYVDGVLVGETEEEVLAQSRPQQVIFSKKDLADGEHTVRLVHTGEFFEGAADSRGAYFSVDAVRTYTGDPGTVDPDPTPTGEIAWARIPQQEGTKLNLHGRDALMLTADLKIGGVHDMYYTTSQLFDAPLETADGLLQTVVGYRGDAGETVLRASAGYTVDAPAGVTHVYDEDTQQLRLNYTHTATPTDVSVTSAAGDTLILRIMDRQTAADTWHIEGIRGEGNDKVLVEGAYLVRTVEFDGSVAHITGSMDAAGTLRVTLPDGITSYTWNGGTLTNGAAAGPQSASTPELEWVTMEGAPEAAVDFDDSDWTLANATTALQFRQGPGSNGVVLDSNRYGFHNGSVWYRADYTAATTNPTLTFRGNGGTFGAQRKNPAFFQVWVNGVYAGARTLNGSTQSIPAPAGVVTAGEDVTVAVVAHNLGLNLDWSDDGLSRQNRGLYEANLAAQSGTEEWRIQGSADPFGDADPMRGMYNTGGKYGERQGWHLPGLDTADWDPATTMVATEPGIQWYRTSVTLDVPEDQDTVWRLEVDADNFGSSHPTRTNGSQVDLYVNGWNIGVFIGDVGPQSSFTIPVGFLNPRGENEIAVSVAAKSAGQGPNTVRLVPVHSTTGAPADFEPYPAVDADEYRYAIATTPRISVADAPAAILGGSQGTIEYTLSNVPRFSVLEVTAPEGWQVSPTRQWTADGTATVDVVAPATGLSGTITATVTTPDGRTATATHSVGITDPALIPVDGIVAWDSAEPGEPGVNGFVSAAIDGNRETYWHTQWSGGSPQHPHYLVLDLGSAKTFTSFTYVPRSNCGSPLAPPACNGTIAGYQIHVADEDVYTEPTAAQLLQRSYPEPAGASYTQVASGTWATNNTDPKTVTFDEPVTARYVKLVSTSAVGGQAWAHAAELELKGDANIEPVDLPDVPLGAIVFVSPETAAQGSSVTVEGAGFAPESEVTVTLGSASVTTDADADGMIDVSITVPAGQATGEATVSATDGSVTATATVTVTAGEPTNAAPVVAPIEDLTVQEDASVSVQVQATDEDGDVLSYTATGLPAGLTLNASTGLISGATSAVGSHVVTVAVTDGTVEVSESFTLTVTAKPAPGDTTAPVISPVATVSGKQGVALSVQVNATDDSLPLTFAASGLPAGLSINAATGLISGTPTGYGSATATVTVTDAAGNSATTTVTFDVARATVEFVPSVPYTKPGVHFHNGRQWVTTCEPYSQTERCRTDIWASVVKRDGDGYSIERGWAFNNLTYLPYMTRAQWASNPLGYTNSWKAADESLWRTECDTAATGSNACRSYRWTTVYTALPKAEGGYTFGQENKWVFNNMVMFRTS